jgi:hypothetical protein
MVMANSVLQNPSEKYLPCLRQNMWVLWSAKPYRNCLSAENETQTTIASESKN